MVNSSESNQRFKAPVVDATPKAKAKVAPKLAAKEKKMPKARNSTIPSEASDLHPRA